jgi:sugar phosphate isomerase/epimerase
VPRLKIGIAIAGLPMPLKKALVQAAEWGADAVEIDARRQLTPEQLSQTAARQLRKMLDDLGLRVAAVAFPTRRGYETSEHLEARIDATKAAMRMAYELRSPLVINRVGRVPASGDATEWKLLVEALTDLGAYGNHVGALLAAETGNESGDDLARLLAAIPQGAIGVSLNPGNLVLGGFSPLEAVEALGTAILHVHATDAVRDPSGHRGEPAPLGEGTADFPALLGVLEQAAYRGYFTIEHASAEDPLREIPAAIRYLRKF